MPIKYFFVAIALMLTANVFAQDVITLVINGKKIGERTLTDSPVIITVNKMKYKNISDIILIVKQQSRYSVYKRTIEITDENENNLYLSNESSTKPEWYKISLSAIRSNLIKQKAIKVFLAENPANDMMKLPSRRKLLVELHLR